MMKFVIPLMVVCVLLLSATIPSYAETVTVSNIITDTNTYSSIVGITQATHYSIFYFTYDNVSHKLLSSKGGTNNFATYLLTSASDKGVTADPWDTTSTTGYGYLNGRVVFTWGIPTPWGAAGANWSDDCFCQCYGSGVYGQS